MNSEEKRHLAEILVPHLAWDLSRSEVFTFDVNENVSGTAQEMLISQVVQSLRAKAARGERFAVAIIPKSSAPAQPVNQD
ncbi:MAG TPA: hypothetical protein VGB98_09050 [Pyrinomonadaceae bacterium]|jgi:hypothetical protein